MQNDLAEAIEKVVTDLEKRRVMTGSSWEGDMPLKVWVELGYKG